jgi:hypothetical protein
MVSTCHAIIPARTPSDKSALEGNWGNLAEELVRIGCGLVGSGQAVRETLSCLWPEATLLLVNERRELFQEAEIALLVSSLVRM